MGQNTGMYAADQNWDCLAYGSNPGMLADVASHIFTGGMHVLRGCQLVYRHMDTHNVADKYTHHVADHQVGRELLN